MEISKYETVSLKEIKKWEKDKHRGFHKKVLDVVSRPVDYVLGKIGPKKLKNFENAVEKTIQNLLTTSTCTIDPEDLIQRAHAHGVMIKDLSELRNCDLGLLDDCNRKHIKFHEKASAIQGAVGGLGGIVMATMDLTALLVQDFHMVQEIALCYGYDPNDIIEKEIILRIIEIGVGGSEIKFKALKEIGSLKRIKSKSPDQITAQKGVSVLGSKALEEYIEHLTAALIVRLVPRALPVVSMAVSAHSNHEIIEHSGQAAFMVYRKRFIERKKKIIV
ncbi:MAG: EcsC family protein [Planctomycetes bacterium]|nr:EcsC family protein [Planctomycetota bacterium]